jgi:hypothetical protein
MNNFDIDEARESLGLSQRGFMRTFFGSEDAAQYRKYLRGERELPWPALSMVKEALCGLPEWTVNTDIDYDKIWISHNRWPRIIFQVSFNDDGSRDIETISAIPEKLDSNDIIEFCRRADSAYRCWYDAMAEDD